MAFRILAATTLAVALVAPALAAETTKYETSVNCYSHYSRSSRSGNWTNCTRETKIMRPEPYKPNCAYLPNFGGVNPRCQ